MIHLALIVAIAWLSPTPAITTPNITTPPTTPTDPVAVYHELDGTWRGTFVGFDAAGRELYRIRVEQVYETVDATTQRVRVKDTMPDGTVITGEGENTARRRPDGSLELRCVVRKSNGERVEHAGRVVRGPGGGSALVWHSRSTDRTETFLEQVRTVGERTLYEINGMGRYGGSAMLMQGRYVRQADS
ncbi:MAG: hypothetical protein HKN62_08435 [Phycisphaerales bacterium]|nr:hypothetical protein [Phycisphaerales bacterium]